MAQQPKKTADSNVESLETLFEFSDKTPEDIAVDNLIDELKSSTLAEVKINRVLPNNKLAYICSVHPNEFTMDMLRDEYGGGKFRIFVFGVGDDGKKVLRASPQFDVEKPKEKPQVIIPQNPANDVAQLLNGFGQMMAKGFEQLGQLIVSTQREQKSPDQIQQEFLQQMLLMKQLFDRPEPQHSNVDPNIMLTQSLQMLQQGIEMGKGMAEVRGESSNTDVLMKTIEAFGPVIAQGMVAQHNQAPSSIIQPVRQTPPPQIPQPATMETNDMNTMQQYKLKMALNFLVDAAQRNLSTTTYAELALDTLGDTELDAIINNPETLNEFAKVEPRINQHKIWFETMLNEMKMMVTDSPEDDITGNIPANLDTHETDAYSENTDSETIGNS